MFGFIIGTVCLIALCKVARRGCGYGGYGRFGAGGGCGPSACGPSECGPGGGKGWGGGWGYRGGWGRHWGGHHGGYEQGEGGGGWGARSGFERMMLRRISEELQASPAQERVIFQAFSDSREAITKAFGEFRQSREDVANAMRAETFDESAMGNLFAKHDEAMTNLRKALMGAFAKVHEALDPQQRARLADLIARGPGGWGRFGGPYRA